VVSDDELKVLERRFGAAVRLMGSWNSDGVFSYSSVPVAAVERAVERLRDATVANAFYRVKASLEPTRPFVELLEEHGLALIDEIVTAYREYSVERSLFQCELRSKPCGSASTAASDDWGVEKRHITLRAAV